MKSGLLPVHDHPRRFAEMRRIAAEKLHAERTLRLDELEILQRPLVAPKDPLRRHELRDHHVRADTPCRAGEKSCPSPRPSARGKGEGDFETKAACAGRKLAQLAHREDAAARGVWPREFVEKTIRRQHRLFLSLCEPATA